MTQSKPEFHTGTVVMLAMCVVFCGLIVAIVFPVIQGDGVAFTSATPLAANEKKAQFEEFQSNPFEYASSTQNATIVDATLTQQQSPNPRVESKQPSPSEFANNTTRTTPPAQEPAYPEFEPRDNSSWQTDASPNEFAFDRNQAVAPIEQPQSPAPANPAPVQQQQRMPVQVVEDFSQPSGEAAVAEIADMVTTAASPQLVASQMPTGSVYAPITVHPVTLHLDGLLKDQLTMIQQKFDESLMRQQQQIEQIAALHSIDKDKDSEERKAKRLARNEQRLREKEERLKIAEISSGFRRLEQTVISLEQKTQERLAEISDAAHRSELAAQTIRDYQRALAEQETRIASLPEAATSGFDKFAEQKAPKPEREPELKVEQNFAPVPKPERIAPAETKPAEPNLFTDFEPLTIAIPESGEEPDSVSDITISAETSDENEAQVKSQIEVITPAITAEPQPEIEQPAPAPRRTTPSQIYIAPRGQSGRYYPAVPANDRSVNPSQMTPTQETPQPVGPESEDIDIQPRDVGFQKTFEFSMDVEDPDSTTSTNTPSEPYRYQVSMPLTAPGSRTTEAERLAAVSRRTPDVDIAITTPPKNGIQLVSAVETRPSSRPVLDLSLANTTESVEAPISQPTLPAVETTSKPSGPNTRFRGGRGNNRHVQRNQRTSMIPNLRLPSFPIFRSRSDQSPTQSTPTSVAANKRKIKDTPTVLQTSGRRPEMPAGSDSSVKTAQGPTMPSEIYQPTWNPPPRTTTETGAPQPAASQAKKPGFLSRIAGAFRKIGK